MKEDPVYQAWHLALDVCIVNDASKTAGSHCFLFDPYLLGILHVLCPMPKPFSVTPSAPGAWLISRSYLPGSLAFSFQVGSAQEISGQQVRGVRVFITLSPSLLNCAPKSDWGFSLAAPYKQAPLPGISVPSFFLLWGGKSFPFEMRSLAPIFDV